MPHGFVYILVSPNSDHIKIGRTERPISERLRGINGGEAYAAHGPWELSDFVHVTDSTVVESATHRHFIDRKVNVEGTNELFSVAPHEARKELRRICRYRREVVQDACVHYRALARRDSPTQRSEQISKNLVCRLLLISRPFQKIQHLLKRVFRRHTITLKQCG
ncbi:GIY-YIG nuclease family protein [Bradyrhizobium diazoefficiens]|uniref:GIY-YIG nuclease family protein n=2 Tax=Nitrobacteraceae TaxID=41294 RepID=UPI002011EF1F|nr:GIY-YIG nuclease family protein [Bradyrhizobium diazoefficiens]